MNSDIGAGYARRFFGKENSGSYDRLVRIATIGQDSKWKKKIADNIQTNCIGLDLACGTGILSSLLLENGNKVIGVDLTFSYLKMFSSKGIQMNLVNSNAEMLPFVGNTFDFIVTSYLPKYTNLERLIFECYRVLKSGGCIVLHDFTLPRNSLYKFAWNIYYKI